MMYVGLITFSSTSRSVFIYSSFVRLFSYSLCVVACDDECMFCLFFAVI
jgi:hypothetical protein